MNDGIFNEYQLRGLDALETCRVLRSNEKQRNPAGQKMKLAQFIRDGTKNVSGQQRNRSEGVFAINLRQGKRVAVGLSRTEVTEVAKCVGIGCNTVKSSVLELGQNMCERWDTRRERVSVHMCGNRDKTSVYDLAY